MPIHPLYVVLADTTLACAPSSSQTQILIETVVMDLELVPVLALIIGCKFMRRLHHCQRRCDQGVKRHAASAWEHSGES